MMVVSQKIEKMKFTKWNGQTLPMEDLIAGVDYNSIDEDESICIEDSTDSADGEELFG